LRAEYGTLDRIERVLELVGFVNSAPGFDRQPAVIDAASIALHDVFGEAAERHARSSIGVAELPQGAAVEIEMVVVVSD
jgi:enamine deaminase RidA (YjgF/YER057c/UK114 family)